MDCYVVGAEAEGHGGAAEVPAVAAPAQAIQHLLQVPAEEDGGAERETGQAGPAQQGEGSEEEGSQDWEGTRREGERGGREGGERGRVRDRGKGKIFATTRFLGSFFE